MAGSIYEAYPRKTGKPRALKAITEAIKRVTAEADAPDDPASWLLSRVQAYAASPAGQSPDAGDDFRPHPATWFSNDRYHDAESEWSRPNGNSPRKAQNAPHNLPTLKPDDSPADIRKLA